MLRVIAVVSLGVVILTGCTKSAEQAGDTANDTAGSAAADRQTGDAAEDAAVDATDSADTTPDPTDSASSKDAANEPEPDDTGLRDEVSQLLSLMASDAEIERTAAREDLDELGESAIRYVVLALNEGTRDEQIGAATFLVGRVSPRDTAAQTALIKALDSENVKLRHMALQAIEKQGEAELASAVPALVALAENKREDDQYRVRAVRAVAKAGSSGADATAALEQLAKHDRSMDVRKASYYAIAKVSDAQAAETFYIARLQSSDQAELRRLAAKWLSGVARTEASVKALAQSLADEDPDVRLECVDTLVAIGRPALSSLVQALDSPDAQVRRHAVLAIGKLGVLGKAAIPALKKHLDDPDQQVRTLAASAISALQQ